MELPSSVVACHGWSGSVLGVGFAGSAVVHSTGGVSPLAGTVVLGPRKGRVENHEEIGCHNLPLVVIGTFALRFGWYGFEPGSTLGTRDGTTEAMATQVAMTALGAAACGIMVFLLRCAIMRNYDVGGLCTCILGGLVSITLGCGDMECGSAVAIGANVEPSHLDEASELDVCDDGPRGAVPTIEYLHDCLQLAKLEQNIAWHVSMVVPVVMLVICAFCMQLMCWDMPTAHNHDPAVIGNTQRPSMWDYVDMLRDVRVVVMICLCYACFSTELAKNKHLVMHSRTYSQLDASDASAFSSPSASSTLACPAAFGLSLLLALCADGSGHFLWYGAFCEPAG
ncbi:Ammonium transporter 1 member 1 [Symbiodinium microadriaticum]|uniref:Ammonium transporter 1 member 1 n=1 Tax=Symbiodinium microadriaticum TaxID=2951 RepID=A0A1Q9DBG6_SYMMI|nr:Ammonium transporter 1 member 1 [Symbiodinium microadriaticum]